MVRYKPSQFTKKELEVMVGVLAVDKGLDFLTGGRLNKLSKKAAVAAYRMIVRPVATRAVLPAAASVGRAAFGASRILMTNPYVAGATAIYVGYQERERIKQLLDQGYEFVAEEVAPPVSQFLQEEVFTPEAAVKARARGTIGIPSFASPPRRPSKFNMAVKAGMKTVKKSTSYGKRGVITNAKKAFTLVTKLASAKKKKKKAPKSGLRRRIWDAMKGLR
jgi:hypothetical protein